MKALFLIPLAAVALSSCSVGVRPRSGRITKTVILAQAEIAFKLSPTVENHIALGMALANYDRHEAAVERYELAAAMKEGGAVAHAHLCVENNILKRWDEAIRNCEKALIFHPDQAVARNGLQFAQKAKALEVELLKDSAPHMNLGMEQYAKGAWAVAAQVWSEVPEKSPHFAMARNNLASAYIMLKDFESARTALNEALRLEPNNNLFLNNVQWLERESKKAD